MDGHLKEEIISIEFIQMEEKEKLEHAFNNVSLPEKEIFKLQPLLDTQNVFTNLVQQESVRNLDNASIVGSQPEEFECTVCQKVYRSEFAIELHMLDHRKHKISKARVQSHICDLCGKCCTTSNGLKLHRERLHTTGSPYACEFCNKKFKCVANMKHHMKVVHANGKKSMLNNVEKGQDQKRFPCSQCSQTFTLRKSADLHYIRFHDSRYQLKNHAVVDVKADSAKSFKCRECPKSFMSSYNLKIHDLKVHSPHIIIKGKKRTLAEHQALSQRSRVVKRYSCTECQYRFYKPSELRMHDIKQHEGRNIENLKLSHPWKSQNLQSEKCKSRYSCANCKKEFVQLSRYEQHMAKCCGESLRNVDEPSGASCPTGDQDTNMLGSQSECTQHVCSECRKNFSTAHKLELHFVSAHKSSRSEAVFDCCMCKMKFITVNNLIRHQLKHSSDDHMKYNPISQGYNQLIMKCSSSVEPANIYMLLGESFNDGQSALGHNNMDDEQFGSGKISNLNPSEEGDDVVDVLHGDQMHKIAKVNVIEECDLNIDDQSCVKPIMDEEVEISCNNLDGDEVTQKPLLCDVPTLDMCQCQEGEIGKCDVLGGKCKTELQADLAADHADQEVVKPAIDLCLINSVACTDGQVQGEGVTISESVIYIAVDDLKFMQESSFSTMTAGELTADNEKFLTGSSLEDNSAAGLDFTSDGISLPDSSNNVIFVSPPNLSLEGVDHKMLIGQNFEGNSNVVVLSKYDLNSTDLSLHSQAQSDEIDENLENYMCQDHITEKDEKFSCIALMNEEDQVKQSEFTSNGIIEQNNLAASDCLVSESDNHSITNEAVNGGNESVVVGGKTALSSNDIINDQTVVNVDNHFIPVKSIADINMEPVDMGSVTDGEAVGVDGECAADFASFGAVALSSESVDTESVSAIEHSLPLSSANFTEDKISNNSADPPSYKCSVCQESFDNFLEWRNHLPSHLNSGKTFECAKCDKIFFLTSRLKQHMRNIHGEEKFQMECQICTKLFKNDYFLKKHLAMHERKKEEKPIICEFCGKMFKTSSSYCNHRRKHTNEKPYECIICERRFTLSSSLRVHLRSHSDNMPFQCPQCPKKFNAQYRLTKHLNVHSDCRETFECDVCNTKYKARDSLNQHMKVHTGTHVRTFECEVCSKRFFTSSAARIHFLRQHTDYKPYACSVCGKRFLQTTDLRKHLRMHTGEKPFKCTVCQKSFSTNSGYHQHVRTHSK